MSLKLTSFKNDICKFNLLSNALTSGHYFCETPIWKDKFSVWIIGHESKRYSRQRIQFESLAQYNISIFIFSFWIARIRYVYYLSTCLYLSTCQSFSNTGIIMWPVYMCISIQVLFTKKWSWELEVLSEIISVGNNPNNLSSSDDTVLISDAERKQQ